MDAHVVVRGRVQGVGFRWFVRERARAAGVVGWVKNRPDGAVEVVARGESAAVGQLLDELRDGPPGAVVSAIEELEAISDALPNPFTIIR